MKGTTGKVAGMLALLTIGIIWLWVCPARSWAQAANGIAEPPSGEVISGIVTVRGTASDSAFLRYEIAFLQASRPGAEWIVFAQGDQPVVDGTLTVWDTTVGGESNPVFPDGEYQLRLRVVRSDYNYDEFFVRRITVDNGSLTPSPSPTLTTTVQVATLTPVPNGTGTVPPPLEVEILPSLTPFPTPSPLSAPPNALLGPGSPERGEERDRPGLLDQLAAVDTGGFGRAFWQGVRLVGLAFVALAIYLVLRGLFRWLWRTVRSRLFH